MNRPCALCGETKHEIVSEIDRHGNPLRTILCLGCGVITNSPIPSDVELTAFYRKDYRKHYKGSTEPSLRQVWRNLGRIEDHLLANREIYGDRKNCLDLGSGSGEFMFLAGAIGMNCIGVEPNEGYANYSREKLGLSVTNKTLEEMDFKEGSFDLIRLSHVLEHMRDPVRSLKVLNRWLSDDGLLFIDVPNIENEASHKMHGRMFHFGHIYNFNPMTLRLAAGLAGFAEIEQSAARLAHVTSAFFRKNHGTFLKPDGLLENANKTKRAMDAHNARTFPKPEKGNAITGFFSKLGVRINEITKSALYRSHRSIADASAKRLKDRLKNA